MTRNSQTNTRSTNRAPIDIIITWFDGRDIEHLKIRSEYSAKHNNTSEAPPLAAEVNAARRLSYANELDIALRSIDRYAPWVRKVFIITNGQIPKDLDALPEDLQAKINIVDHKVIFAGHHDYLPTFNAIAIETVMWRIPDLSEQFIFFNDDMFLTAPCEPELFFSCGTTTLMGKWVSLPTGKAASFAKSIHRAAKLNAAAAMGFSAEKFFSQAHVAMPMRVSVLKTIFDSYPNWFAHNAASRFRGADQYLVQGLFAHHIINTQSATFPKRRFDQNMSASYCKKVPYWVFKVNCALIKFWPKRFRLICVNDLSLLNERFGGKASDMIRKAIGIS